MMTDGAFQSGEKAPDERDDKGRFVVPPKSPGRPKGSRNQLGEDFIKALHADFQEHGIAAIQSVRTNKPDAYLKVIASILPKQVDLKVNDYDGMDDGQLRHALSAALRDLAAFGVDIGVVAGQNANASDQNQPAQTLQAVH